MSTGFTDLPGDIDISFEFFPPKTEAMEATLWDTVQALAPYDPRFVSVTYGAGGSTRARTHATVTRIETETGIPAAAHLTCVGASRDEVLEIARDYWAAGIRHIVALRGDPPSGEGFAPHPEGFSNASELTAALLTVAPFEISVAAYPEIHPEAASAQADLAFLKAKIDAGAKRAITQAFFDVEAFLRFRDQAVAAGIKAELVPGILPIVNAAQARKFARSIPPAMERLLEGLDAQPEARPLVAASIGADMCRALYAEGVRQFHFFTLNRAPLTASICHLLGRKAALQPASALVSGT
jgi:methylenetetrahydrofolate reductase (NADPH)